MLGLRGLVTHYNIIHFSDEKKVNKQIFHLVNKSFNRLLFVVSVCVGTVGDNYNIFWRLFMTSF